MPQHTCRTTTIVFQCMQYIRKLIFSDLDKLSVEHVLRQLHKLPWAECEQYLLKCFLKVHKGKYSQVHLIALLTAGLSHCHGDFAVAVVNEQDLLDPPEDCFRIRMIITLLQTCARYFDRGSSKRKLDRFLLYFQRYVLTKGPLPLDIEFDVQDVLAELRPNIIRCLSMEELNSALVELEENEHAASSEKGGSEERSGSRVQTKQSEILSSDANGESSANRPEENGRDHEVAAEDESYSDNGSISHNGHEDEDSLFEEISDDRSENEVENADDDMPDGSDGEESLQFRQKVVQVDPMEQEDFDRELKALLQESLESRKLEQWARPTLNMMIPMNVFEGSTDPKATEAENGEENAAEESGSAGRGSKVCVKVLVKKRHRQQTKQMLIPGDCYLVHSIKHQAAAKHEEKQNIKRKILEYNEMEEEEWNGGSLQTGNWFRGGSNTSSSIRPAGHVSWDGSNRSGGAWQQRYNITGGFYFYPGYGSR